MGQSSSPLRLHARYRPVGVPGEGLFLLSERDNQFFEGQVFADLADHLTSGQDAHTVADALAPVHDRAVTHYALDELVRRDVLVETTTCPDEPRARFWDELGLDPGQIDAALATTTVTVRTIGDVDPEPLETTLAELGTALGTEDGQTPTADGIHVVLTDDYLAPRLGVLARALWEQGQRWLLARTTGRALWIGPFFSPGGPCYACLATRLGSNRALDAYIGRRVGWTSVTGSRASTPAHARLAGGLVALETAKGLVGQSSPSQVRVVDLATLESSAHRVVRRPQCMICGDGALQAELMTTPPRIEGVDEVPFTLAELRAFVSPVTGIVSAVSPVDSGLPHGPTYTAQFGFGGEAQDLQSLKNTAISQGAGVGETAEEAEAGAILEALERHCGTALGDEPALRARYVDLDPATALDPTTCMLYSERQYARRAEINHQRAAFDAVPEPFDDTAMLDWTGVWSMTEARFKLLPSSFLFYFYPRSPGGPYCWADSNGCAAGTSLGDAVVRALYELIERDGVAIWWYNRLRRPALDLEAAADSHVRRLVEEYAAIGREVWALDLTTDLGVPTVAAVSRRTGGDTEDIVLGFGAHLDQAAALRHAVLEMNHIMPAVLPANRTADGDYPYPEAAQKRWWRTATTAREPYLLPSVDPSPPLQSPAPETTTAAVLDVLRHRLEGAGHEVLVLDQTRPDVRLPVAKVIVPGLRHFWSRLAPGRLYDVPVTMGWSDRALTEDELNPTAMFL